MGEENVQRVLPLAVFRAQIIEEEKKTGGAGRADERLLPRAIIRAQNRSSILLGGDSAAIQVQHLKRQIGQLEQEIAEAKSTALDSFLPPVLCKCYTDCFSPVETPAPSNLNDDSVSRFLKCVRLLNAHKKRRLEDSPEDDREVGEVADFIVELVSSMDGKLLTVWLHQAVESVKTSVVCLLNSGHHPAAHSTLKKLVNSLILKVVGFDPDKNGVDCRRCIGRILLQLCEIPFAGQKLLVEVTTQLGVLSETLSHADPFGCAQLTENVYFLLQLLSEALDRPFSSWIKDDKIDARMLEAFVTGFFQMKAAMVGTRLNLLFVTYTDRICAQLVKQLQAVGGRGDEELEKVVVAGLQRLVELATREFQR